MSTSKSGGALRLPQFVTAQSVGEILNWANSIRREFRAAASEAVVDGWTADARNDVYEDVVRLLALPCGGFELDRIVTAADADKRRGLTRALHRRALTVLGANLEKRDDAADIIVKLQIAGEFELAAWLAFERLTWTGPPQPDHVDTLVDLIETTEDLRAALGDYWTDWRALSADEAVPGAHGGAHVQDDGGGSARESACANITPEPHVRPDRLKPEAAEFGDLEYDRRAWAEESRDLRSTIGEAREFDASLLERLRAGLELLETLVSRAAQRAEHDSERLAELARSHLEALRADLAHLHADGRWRDDLLSTAERIPAEPEALEELRAAADWASQVRARTEAVASRRAKALERAQLDDSEEAGANLSAANAERRRVRQETDVEGAAWAGRLGSFAEAPPSPVYAPVRDLDVVEVASAEADSWQDDEPGPALAEAPTRSGGDLPTPEPAPVPSGATLEPETKAEPAVLRDAPPAKIDLPQTVPAEPAGTEPFAAKEGGEDQELAATAALDKHAAGPSAYSSLVEQALDLGRYGLAAHLQRAIETLGAINPTPAPSGVLEALCIGASITASRLAIAEHRYAAVLPSVLAELSQPSGVPAATRLLAFAGGVKPALFTLQSSAAEAIRAANIGGLGGSLHELTEFIVDELPKRGGVLDIASLRPAGDEQAAREEVNATRARLLEMADEAPAKKALFQRATIIWRDLFMKEGAVANVIAALRRRGANAAALAEEAAGELEEHLEQRARELDRAAKRNRDAWLEGKALEWLLNSMRELTDLLHRYVASARRLAGPASTHTAETQQMLTALVAAARRDVAHLESRAGFEAAARAAGRILDDVSDLLAGRAGSADSPLTVDALLDGDLLLVRPYPALARRRTLNREAAAGLLATAGSALEVERDFSAALQALLVEGRFDEAEEAAARLAPSGPIREKLDVQIDDARLDRLGALEVRAARLRTQLDDILGADTEGRIDPAASVQLESLVAPFAGPHIDHTAVARRLDFPAVEGELSRLETIVHDGAELLLAPLLREIERLSVPDEAAAVLQELAHRRELTTLRECVNGLREGAEMHLGGKPEKLLRAFSEGFLSPRFAQLEARHRNVAELLPAVSERRDGAVDFSLLAEEDVPGAEALLAAWQKFKRGAGEPAAALRELLTELRFANVRISEERKLQRAHRYSVLVGATSDRRDCPVPAFGSGSNGRLEVLVVEAVNVADGVELHGLVKGLEHASTVPTLVIVKGRLPADRRIAFMTEARRRATQEPCALLDEASIVFLAAWPGRRRSDTFAVSLPCGGVQPYSDASGKTSPEMFFGRAAELGELWRADGSCLVYGGRQLGKTALLEQVRLRNHRPPGQIVVYGSLQGETDVWRKVAQLLTPSGLPVKGHSAAAVEAAVKAWLKEHDARRILILIDEADTYLEKEMQEGYPTLARVRDLMQATERRCKFVFAGLHNVQRLARAPNSPLLHFGTPLQIGPLYRQDLGEAREMVVGPMAAAGIVFENPTLPNRILSAVGFYPSLVQTFGATLIERVNRTGHGRLRQASPLPIVVTDQEIQNALDDHAFKENIRNKFRMTLSLDERYRLITLAMLQRSLERRDQTSITPSLTDVEVQALARDWWPQGFEEDSSLDAFQGLLQEMVGLGVLVESDGRYAIRSSRIAAMLGGKEQIDQELIELSSSPGPEELDTGSLRRLDRTTRVPSPLTSRQEGQLLGSSDAGAGVHLALGSVALGLNRVAASLAELQDEELGIRTATYRTARELGMHLANAREQVRSGRGNLLVVNGPWLGREMVDMALEAVARRAGRKGAQRVLIAPSWVDWSAIDEVDDHGRLWGADLMSLSTLGRSGLRQWLRACNVTETTQSIETLRSLTGGFPLFLADLGRTPDLMAAARKAHDERVARSETLEEIGLGDARLLGAARIVAEFEPSDLAADLKSLGVESGDKVIGHLERLGVLEVVQVEGDTRWQLNPFVASVLARQH